MANEVTGHGTGPLLTPYEGFQAMSAFLSAFYERTSGGVDLAVLLADLDIQNDGMPNDPAAWSDWLKSVEDVLAR